MEQPITLRAYQMTAPREPFVRIERRLDPGGLAADQVVVEIAGCGVCHTDLGFYYDGVRTGRPLPLILGHEIAGTVVAAGADQAGLVGRRVVVPAVVPCGRCALCLAGRGSICRAQLFFGSDLDGGFASHVVAPGRGLCLVDDAALAGSGLALADLAVLADAVSTPYQAIVRSGLGPGDVAIFVGAGGVGGFGAQIAHALGARVVAIDVDPARLELLAQHGADLTVMSRGREPQEVRKEVAAWVKGQGLSPFQWKIFETSGHPGGQLLAFTLLTYGAVLSVVGFTLEKVSLRLANLMAFDAVAQGNWGCLPAHYPAALALLLGRKVALGPFIEHHPMSRLGALFEELHDGRHRRRPVLVPDFS